MRSPLSREQVQELYEEALSRRSPEALAAAGADLGAIAMSQAHEHRGTQTHFQTGFESISSPEARRAFEKAFEATDDLFNRIDITIPEPDELMLGATNEHDEAVDFAWLGAEYERLGDEGFVPEIVLAPQNISLPKWHQLYANLKYDRTIRDNPLEYTQGSALLTEVKIVDDWASISSYPLKRADKSHVPVFTDLDGINWTVRIVTGGDPIDAQVDGSSYDPLSSLPSIQEYLTLQALQIQKGDTPYDEDGMSYMADTTGTQKWAVTGTWDTAQSKVGIFNEDTIVAAMSATVRPCFG